MTHGSGSVLCVHGMSKLPLRVCACALLSVSFGYVASVFELKKQASHTILEGVMVAEERLSKVDELAQIIQVRHGSTSRCAVGVGGNGKLPSFAFVVA